MILFALVMLLLQPGQVFAPEYTEPPRPMIAEISRGIPELVVERRVMRVTAYTNNDFGMDGKGITASGERTQEGRTIAAPPEIPLYTQIYIPKLGQTYTVTDRGGAIKVDRLDLYIEDLDRALQFGAQELEVYIKY